MLPPTASLRDDVSRFNEGCIAASKATTVCFGVSKKTSGFLGTATSLRQRPGVSTRRVEEDFCVTPPCPDSGQQADFGREPINTTNLHRVSSLDHGTSCWDAKEPHVHDLPRKSNGRLQ